VNFQEIRYASWQATSTAREEVFSMADHVMNSRREIESLFVNNILFFNSELRTKLSRLTKIKVS